MNAALRNASLLIVAAALLGGCGRDMSDLEQWVEEQKRRPAGRIEPLPQIQPYETFVYEAHEHRSPFSPSVAQQQAGVGDGISPDPSRTRQYLEEFPLDTLRMVGTVEMGAESYGLIRTGDGAVHRVKAGDYVGQNHGRITQITDTGIRLMEIIPDGMGGWTERRAAIALSE